MKFIRRFLKPFFTKELPQPMGRWNIEYCNTKMNQKIDLSNEDHCGPCGQYAITKLAVQSVAGDLTLKEIEQKKKE